MAKAELKTKVNNASVADFINDVDEKRRDDVKKIHQMMEKVVGEKGKMWGKSIIGYGSYHYKYASGREGDWMLTGLSPRKQNITVYIMPGFDRYDDLMQKLGKYKTGKSCLYINTLDDVNFDVLTELVKESVEFMREQNS